MPNNPHPGEDVSLAACEHCGHDHPAYAPCPYPPAWEDAVLLGGIPDEATAFAPAPEGYEAIQDDDGADTGYRRELATGLIVFFDEGDEDDG